MTALDPTVRRPLHWLSVLVALVVFAASMFDPLAFADGDPYWHVATGEWILANGRVPVADTFSWSRPGMAWTAHEWLSEVMMATAVRAAGWHGLQVLASLCFAVTAGYLMQFLLARLRWVNAVALGLLSLSVTQTHFATRPHVLVWPLMAVWVGTLVTASESRRAPPSWLPLVMLVWVNMHGSFTLGLALAGGITVDAVLQEPDAAARRRTAGRWALFLLLSLGVTLLNPRGLGVNRFALDVMRMEVMLRVVQEWRSANFHHFYPILAWIFVVFGLALSGYLRLPLMRTCMVLGTLYLALKHQRYHALVGLITPYLLASPLAQGIPSAPAQPSALGPRTLRPAGAGGIALALAMAVGIARLASGRAQHGPAAHVTPAVAVRAAESSGVCGRVLNSYAFGGYLIHRGIPVYMDGRGDAYGDSALQSMSDAFTLRRPFALDSLLETHQVAWTLLASGEPAIALLDHLPAWQRLYADSIAVVHVRRDLRRPLGSPTCLEARAQPAMGAR